jgi:hypothetical protein
MTNWFLDVSSNYQIGAQDGEAKMIRMGNQTQYT